MYELSFALLIAVVLAPLLYLLVRPRPGKVRGDKGAALAAVSLFKFLLIVVFLGTLAGGLWLQPFGPVAWEVAWVPFLMVGILIALLLAAAGPNHHKAFSHQVDEQDAASTATFAFGLFFWILVFTLIVAIGFSYWY